jgi:hypothetical protein
MPGHDPGIFISLVIARNVSDEAIQLLLRHAQDYLAPLTMTIQYQFIVLYSTMCSA